MRAPVDDTTDGLALSVVIKTFNEAAKIGRCLSSVQQALAVNGTSCEVIVADSLSTDNTAAIAQQFGVRVVQFVDAADRGCGAGVQLGFQASRGRFVLLLDGDMQLQPDFLPAALAALEADAGLAGVAGLLIDTHVRNAFDRHRVSDAVSSVAREERWLNGGGLYRREAIVQAQGYAADRNLKGWEEADLGMRLRACGWRLLRIGVVAVHHEGHASSTPALLRRLWRSGRAAAGGVLLRQAWGKPWFGEALRLMAQPLGTLLWWLGGLASLGASAVFSTPLALQVWLGLSALGTALLAIRKRGLRPAVTSLGIWHFLAAGLLIGLAHRSRSPALPIDAVELKALTLEPTATAVQV